MDKTNTELDSNQNLSKSSSSDNVPDTKLEPANFDEDTINELSAVEELAENNFEQPIPQLPKTEYLSKTVLPLIMEGLSWIIKERPSDPVEHLAMFLLKNNSINIDNASNQK